VRVLFVSQRLPPAHVSGAPLQAIRLARALEDENVEVTILTSRFAIDQQPGAFEIDGVRAHRLATIPGSRASYATLAAAYARSAPFDLIHGHALSATCLGAAFGTRVPVLLKPSLAGPDGDLAAIERSPLAPILIRVLQKVDRFAVISPGIGEELRRIGIPEQKLVEAKNGVDLDRFKPEGPIADLGVDGPVILFVGQMKARKRLDLLMQAWLHIARARPDAWLALAGPGDPVLALGVRNDVDALMRRASVLVLPSESEGMPNVVLEARACGLQVVTSARIPSELDAGVVNATPGAIADAALAAIDQPHMRPDAIAAYGFDVVASEYAALYRAI
jgi:glycosyltransferase involved in cell wall biosynthesis